MYHIVCNDRFDLVTSPLLPDQEHKLRLFLVRRLRKGAIYTGTGNFSGMDFRYCITFDHYLYWRFDSLYVMVLKVIVGRASVVSIATQAGRSGDRIPVGARFSAPIQTGPGAHPASCMMGTGSFPGVNAVGA